MLEKDTDDLIKPYQFDEFIQSSSNNRIMSYNDDTIDRIEGISTATSEGKAPNPSNDGMNRETRRLKKRLPSGKKGTNS